MRIVDQSGKMSISSEGCVILIDDSVEGEYKICAYGNGLGKHVLALYDDYERTKRLFDIIINDESVGAKICNINKKMIWGGYMVLLRLSQEEDVVSVEYDGSMTDIINEQIQLSHIFYLNLFKDMLKEQLDEEDVSGHLEEIQNAMYTAIQESFDNALLEDDNTEVQLEFDFI